MKKVNLFARTLGVLVLILASSLGVLGQTLIASYGAGTSSLNDATGNYGNLVVGSGATTSANGTCTDNAYDYQNTLKTPSITGLNLSSMQIDFKMNLSVMPTQFTGAPYHTIFVINDASRFFGLTITNTGYLRVLFNNSTWTSPSSLPLSVGTDYNIKIQHINGSFKVKVNNSIVLDLSLGSFNPITGDRTIYFGDNPGASGVVSACFSDINIINNPLPFSYPPTITTFSPTSAEVGQTVTITGTNFSPTASENIVYFGGIRADVVSATSTQLTVIVPVGASNGYITESVSNQSALSSRSFSVINTQLSSITSLSNFSSAATVTCVSGDNGSSDVIVLAADLDRDGKNDIVKVGGGYVWCSRNIVNAAGDPITNSSFAASQSFQVGGNLKNVIYSDLNSDGLLDIITAGTNGIYYLINNSTVGTISFQNAVQIPGSITNVRSGDFDRDGRIDLISLSGTNTNIYLNTGTGSNVSFSSANTIILSANSTGIDVGDLNNDNKLDFVVSGSGNTFVFINSSTVNNINFSNTFTLPFSHNYVKVDDFDSDGLKDIILYNNFIKNSYVTGTIGLSDFSQNSISVVNEGDSGYSSTDLDGDGYPELFIGTSWDKVRCLINSGTGNASSLFVSYPSLSRGTAVGADFNSDNKIDVLVSMRNFTNTMVVYQNNIPLSMAVAGSPTSLSGFVTCPGQVSTAQTTSVSGSGLSSNMILTAPAGFEISTTAGSGYASTLTLTPSGGTVNATTIYVRLTGATAGSYSGNLTIASTGATTQNVALSGTVNPNPVLSITSPSAVCSPATVDLTAAAVTSGSTNVSTLAYYTDAAASTSLASPSAVTTSGTYYIKATSAAGCTDIQPVTATVNDPISAVVLAVNDMPCGSSATGSASITLTGGAAPFTYAWTKNGVAFAAAPAAAPTNLSSGTYIVTVTDACGSATSNSVTLTNSPSLNLLSATLGANALCFGGNGSIVGVIQGGTNPRTLTATNTLNNTLVYSSSTPSATPAPGQFQYTLNVPAGTYTVSASDGLSSCVSTFNTTISVSQPTTITSTVAKTDVCFGGTNGTITVTASGGTGALQYSIDGGTTYQASNSFTGLSANAYSVVVKDANNCTTTPSSITINQSGSALAVAVTSVTNVACNGASTGAVNITASGGYNTAYTYAWTGPSSFNATTEDLTNRPAGTYNVTVTDAGGCTAQATATLTQPTAVTATIASTNVSCNGGNNGSAAVTVNGGVGPYTYSWSDANGPITIPAVVAEANSPALQGWYTMIGQSFDQMMQTWGQTQSAGQTFTSVGGQLTAIQTHIWGVDYAGNFTFTLYSGAGNTGSILSQQTVAINASGNLTITLPTPITLTAGQQYTFVFSGTQVSARLSITSNQYAGGGSFAQNSNGTTIVNGTNDTWFINSYAAVPATSLSNLTAGTYNVTVTDANGCTFTTSTTITQPTALSASATSTNLTCNLSANGSITVAATGGTAPYTYSTDGTTFASSANITGLAAATYTVTVKDANNCQTTINGITITEPAVLAASISAQTNNTCFGESLGSATVSVTGGTSAYSYSWNSTPVQTSATATTLPAGSYVVSITDASGCTTSATATITQPTQVAATVAATNVLCNGGSTGSITVNGATGGSGSYQYSIDGGTTWGSTSTFSNLTAGTYAVEIQDGSGCIVDLDGVSNTTITEPLPLTASAVKTNVGCFGAATGTVTATAAGGTTPYTYSLNGGTYQSSNIFTALVAGTYTVTVKDANNCTVNTSAVTITQPASALAAGDDGISPASCSNVSDGAIPITVTGGTAPYSYSWTGPNGFTSSVEDQVYNLAAGSYNVTVTDANSCSVTLSGLVITSPPAINISTTSSNVTCYQGSDGAINATVTGGSPSFAYQWKKNGVNFATTEDLTGLSTGSYVLTVTDGNFCQNNTPAIVIIDNPQIVATVAANAASICSGTNAVFTITGTVGNVVTYNLNGGSNTTATIAAGGTATVTVTAATTAQTINLVSVSNGACSNAISATAAVTINALPTANAGADQTVCAGASVTLSGAGTGTYSWNNSVSNGVAFTAVNATSTAITTTYTLTVTNANGCTATDQVDVTVNPIPSIYAGLDATVCEGTSITLSGESCGITTAANLNGVTNVADDNGMPQVGQSFTAITGGTLSAIKLTLWPTGAPQLILRDYNGNVLSSAFGGAILATSNVATNMPSFANWQDLSTFEFTNGPTLVAGQQYTFEIINHSGTYTGLNDTYAGGQSFHTLNQGFAGDMNFAVEICQPNNSVAYSWDNGVINNVAFTAVNGTSASVSTTYTLSVTASGCTNTDQINVTVNPTPTVNNFTAQTVCAGSTNAAVVPTGAVTGTNYAWTNTNTSIGLAASGTGTIPSFTAVNAGATAQTATVTVTPSYGGNMGTVFGEANENGTVTLNAPAGTYFTGVQFASWGTPTGTLGNYSIGSCHAANSSNVVAGLAVGQTTVTIPANNATFGNPCGGVGKSLAVVLTYGTFGSSCSGTAKTYTITVNPTPVVSNKTATICSGSAFTATTGGSDVVPAGTQYTWTVAANANVTGASNQTIATSTISQILTNTTNTVQTVVYTVTPISGTCSGATFTVTVTVNPTPALTSTLTPSALCAPNFFSYTAVSPTVAASGSTVLSWVRQANVGIHEAPTSGIGNINGDLLTNITNTPVTVTYVYTATSNGCSANYSVNVVANPMPYQGFAYNQGAWSGIGHWAGGPFSNTQISAQTFVHNINKPVNSVSVVLNSIGAVGTFPITATIRTVDVNGIPTSTILGTSTITASFTGGMVNYTFPFASPISLGVGTQYAVVFSMSGGAFPVDGPPSAYDSYPYGYIYLSNDNGSSWYQVANDRDMLFSMTYVETICSNNTFTYNFTSPTVGATATWSRPAVIGISQPAATGTGSISEVLTNSTNNVITVPYTYAITANGCTRNETVYVRVNPAPALSSTLTPAAICSNSTFTYVPSSTTQLTSGSYGFTWSRAAVAGISQVASSGSGSINEVLTNTTFLPVTVTYVYTISANGCSATNNVTVVVNPSPVIAAKTNNACSGVAITLAPANGSGDVVPTGTTYTWTVVDNPNVIGETNANTAQTSIVQTLVNNYTSAQQVVYTVTPTFNGCAGTPFTYTVTVSTPVAVAALTGATNVCLGSTTQLASATAGGVWTSSNTAVATISATGVVTGLTTGTTTISYTVTNSVGCTGVVTANVNVNALPVATITPSGSTTICQGSSVTLTASAGSLYLWSNGLQTSSITVSTAGNYSVQVTNAAGCVTTSAVTAVVVNPLPTATITANGPTTFCQGGTVTLTASAGSSYLWSNGATTSSITVNASGCYSVTVTNANGCSATSACTQVTVNALPVASISSLNGTSFCQGGSVTLVSTPGSTYAWSNNLTTQSINVTASANLTVTVTNAAGCSSTSAPFAVTMNPLPTATITAGGPLTFCQGGSVVLTAGGGTSFAWTNSTSTASSITVSTSGVYTVTATNANGCSATSAPVTVTVNALPVVAAIAGSNDVCVGSTTILTNATSGGVWSSSNASAATVSASGVVTGVAAGVATINYTVTNTSGCVTTSSLVINVNAVPVNIPIGGPNTVCVGSTITNFANPGGVWSSSNVSIATVAQNGIITGVAAGTATISYTITNAAGCSSTVTKVVTVNALPTVAVAANGPLTFCQGGSVTLTASGGTSYAWSNSTATTPSITVTTSGSYTVTATNANGCFATSAPVVVNVLALPNAAIASTGSNICLGNTTTLTASGGVSYSWSNGAPTASITVNNSNTYTVTVTGANGCTATASNVVTVNANPAVVVTANAPLTFCQGGSVTLSATGAASYVWSNGTLGSTNVITQSGTYYAQGTNAAGCTSNSAVITVTVLPTPVVAALTGANTVCEASTITLSSATPGGVWSTSNSFVATVNNAGVITGMNAGTAVITYTLSNGACNASVSASVTVLNSPATPVITAGGPTTVCPNETVQLFSSNAPNYQWNSGPQTNNILVTQSGSYTVTVVGSNGCAVTSLPMTVTIGDDIDPIIVAPINVNVNPNLGCTAVGVALGTPIVSDNCTVASVTNNAPALFPIGTTTVTWTVTDASGNSATATQLVNVVDQVAPEATAPAHVTVNTNNFCDATGVNLGTPEATDNCTIASITNDAPASFPIGTTVVTWTITDATGNFTTVTQNVTVVDTEAPVIVLQSAAVQLDANGVGVLTFEAIDNGSSDNCGIAAVSIDQTTFDCGQVGFNTVTVTITDNSGNQTSAEVVINVIASDACGGTDVAGPNVPDAFTPNGNSINDTWVIPGLEGYNTKQMAVYSRYGTLVYYSSAYANDWDGTLMGNGVAVPDGTYYYTLTLDGGKQLSGYVYINRVKQ